MVTKQQLQAMMPGFKILSIPEPAPGHKDKLVHFTCPQNHTASKMLRLLLKGGGCPICAPCEHVTKKALSEKSAVYDYSPAHEPLTRRDIVRYICPKHGVIEQVAYTHMQGTGCHLCEGDKVGYVYAWVRDGVCKVGSAVNYKKRLTTNGAQGSKVIFVTECDDLGHARAIEHHMISAIDHLPRLDIGKGKTEAFEYGITEASLLELVKTLYRYGNKEVRYGTRAYRSDISDVTTSACDGRLQRMRRRVNKTLGVDHNVTLQRKTNHADVVTSLGEGNWLTRSVSPQRIETPVTACCSLHGIHVTSVEKANAGRKCPGCAASGRELYVSVTKTGDTCTFKFGNKRPKRDVLASALVQSGHVNMLKWYLKRALKPIRAVGGVSTALKYRLGDAGADVFWSTLSHFYDELHLVRNSTSGSLEVSSIEMDKRAAKCRNDAVLLISKK